MSQTDSTPTTRRYCEDCRFCSVPATGKSYARCASPKAPAMDVPDRFVAREFDRPSYCSSIRINVNKCGPDAKWFEAALATSEAV